MIERAVLYAAVAAGLVFSAQHLAAATQRNLNAASCALAGDTVCASTVIIDS